MATKKRPGEEEFKKYAERTYHDWIKLIQDAKSTILNARWALKELVCLAKAVGYTELAECIEEDIPEPSGAIKELLEFYIYSLPKRDSKDRLRWVPNKDEIPFFSETGLYDLIGKEDARTILCLLRRLVSEIDPALEPLV